MISRPAVNTTSVPQPLTLQRLDLQVGRQASARPAWRAWRRRRPAFGAHANSDLELRRPHSRSHTFSHCPDASPTPSAPGSDVAHQRTGQPRKRKDRSLPYPSRGSPRRFWKANAPITACAFAFHIRAAQAVGFPSPPSQTPFLTAVSRTSRQRSEGSYSRCNGRPARLSSARPKLVFPN